MLVKKIISSKVQLGICFLVCLVASQFLIQYIPTTWPFLLMGIVTFAAMLIIFLSKFSGDCSIPRNALILLLFLGTANAIIMPVRYNLDENTHFFNALQVADGHFLKQSDERNFLEISPDFLAITKLPSKYEYKDNYNTNIYSEEFKKLKHIKSDYKEKWLNKRNSAIINPAYYPSALGIVIGRIFSSKLMVSYYLGRIFNVIFYALLVYWGLKISKQYRIQLFVMASVPFALWVTSGYSYDSLYYGIIIIIMAQLTNFWRSQEENISLKSLIYYSISCFFLIFCKAPVILIMFLPLAIPIYYYRNKRDKLKGLGIMIVCLGLGGFWLVQEKVFSLLNISKIPTNVIDFANGSQKVESVTAVERMVYFIQHPIDTVSMLLRTISDIFVSIRVSISAPLPFNNQSEFVGIFNLLIFIFLVFIVSLKLEIVLTKRFKAFILLLYCIITLGIFFAITGDDRVFHLGDIVIIGVQGRYHFYFLTMLPLLISDFIKTNKYLTIKENYDLTNFVVKTTYVVAFLNSCLAVYSYL